MKERFIPVASPLDQYKKHQKEIQEAIEKVLEGGRYILGNEVSGFEKEFADFLGAKYSTGVANGTEAISLALKACEIGAGDEVITVSHTAVATVAAIELIGAVPVFVDIDPITRCMNADLIPDVITPKTKAILPVHIYGQPAPMHEIVDVSQRYGLIVVEDCAQACGSDISGQKVGTFGHASAFSFYPTKNLGAIGDGGAVVTSSSGIWERTQMLREYGWKERYISSEPGMNSRLDEIQAAILRVKLPYLQKDNARRREIARKYSLAVDESVIICPRLLPGTAHSMHLYVVESQVRGELQTFLNGRNIGTAFHYPRSVHQQDAYKDRIRGSQNLPVTEKLYERILSLPLYPELEEPDVTRICSALSDWCALY